MIVRPDVRPAQREHVNPTNGQPKRGYKTRQDATMWARRTAKRSSGPPLHAYLCSVCEMWHVGHRMSER